MRSWSIGEVARRTGFSASSIRYYESCGILPAAGRVSGQRRYGSAVLRHLAWIDVARRAGFTLRERRAMLSSSAEARREMARRKIVEVDRMLVQARERKRILRRGLRCRCSSLEACRLLQPDSPSGRGAGVAARRAKRGRLP